MNFQEDILLPLKRTKFLFLLDYIIILFCFFISLYLRLNLDFDETLNYFNNHLLTLVLIFLGHLFLNIYTKYNNIFFESFSFVNFNKIFIHTFLLSLILSISSFFIFANLPRSVVIIFFFLSFACLSFSKLLIHRNFTESIKNKNAKNIILFGAGSTGLKYFNYYILSKNINIIGFIDDNLQKQGQFIQNKKIFSRQKFLDFLKKSSENVDEIWVTCTSITEREKNDIKIFLRKINVKFVFLQQISDILDQERKSINKAINLDEVIKRKKNDELVLDEKFFENKSIIISGAGGSIGSEITKQLAHFNVKKLILVDINEFNLFSIEQDLKNLNIDSSKIEMILGSIENKYFVTNNLKNKKANFIINAAAYKHVDLVQKNKFEALKNNLIGTHNLCELAISEKMQNFLLISTDKAVEPSSFMGLTKRLCELLVLFYGRKNTNVNFSSVRFGNVIGSSGSVIPIFVDRIKQGKNLMVTHPDMKRYFMTIEEASKLVLFSMTLKIKQNICYLDMGEQKNILEIAKKLILLFGLDYRVIDKDNNKLEKNNHKVINIEYSGIK